MNRRTATTYERRPRRSTPVEPVELNRRYALERRMMATGAILASYLFGFVFFKHTVSVMGMLILFGSLGTELAPGMILGWVGVPIVALGFWKRGSRLWKILVNVGTVALVLSWAFFFDFSSVKALTLAGSMPFLATALTLFYRTARESRIVRAAGRAADVLVTAPVEDPEDAASSFVFASERVEIEAEKEESGS